MRICYLRIVIFIICIVFGQTYAQTQTFKNDSLRLMVVKPENWISVNSASDFAKIKLSDDRTDPGIYDSRAFIDFSKYYDEDKDSLLASVRIFVKHKRRKLTAKDYL